MNAKAQNALCWACLFMFGIIMTLVLSTRVSEYP